MGPYPKADGNWRRGLAETLTSFACQESAYTLASHPLAAPKHPHKAPNSLLSATSLNPYAPYTWSKQLRHIIYPRQSLPRNGPLHHIKGAVVDSLLGRL